MEHLFTYGTLQDGRIQLTLFKRKLAGSPDSLLGYALGLEKVDGLYPVIFPTLDKSDRILGKVYEITMDELKKADDYEGEDYQRIQVVLGSGINAWAYVGKNVSHPVFSRDILKLRHI